MHFMIRCDMPLNENGEALMDIHDCVTTGRVSVWQGGGHLRHADTLPNPIMIDFEPLHGYRGPPLELSDLCIPLMSARLADALRSAGVDNVVFYPALLTDMVTGETYEYKAFNVIGLVAAADLKNAEWESYDGIPVVDVSFTRFALDEAKAERHLMFRLAENIFGLVVHESVRDRVLESGIDTLRFMRPEDWMHL